MNDGMLDLGGYGRPQKHAPAGVLTINGRWPASDPNRGEPWLGVAVSHYGIDSPEADAVDAEWQYGRGLDEYRW